MTYTIRESTKANKFFERFKFYFMAAIPVMVVLGVANSFFPPETPLVGAVYGAGAVAGLVAIKDKLKKIFTL